MIHITCPSCGRSFKHSTRFRGETVNCPVCRHTIPFPKRAKWILPVCLLTPALFIVLAVAWLVWPLGAPWPDHRPIGALFMADTFHSSPTNPRGWFSSPALDVTGPGGQERFKKALFNYANNSLTNLLRLGAQGVIVWDVEGEQFPHKTSFIGDPRLADQLAPEMAPVAAEFFKRFRDAGLRVGVTIRPQQLVFENGLPRQTVVLDITRLLLEKIDYARTNWGATLFYIDSNDSFWRPDEVWQLRLLEQERPGVLLIPEHHYLPYWAFTAPYIPLSKSGPDPAAGLARRLFPHSFQVLNMGDASSDAVTAAWRPGDIPLFRAWFWSDESRLIQNLETK